MRAGHRWVLLAILAVALVSRLVFLVWAVGLESPLRGDEVNYQDHAANIAAGRGLVDSDGRPAASRPPLLPLVLGAIYLVTGPHVEVGRLVQVLVGTAVVALTYLLARRLFSARIALGAAALAAVNPYLIFISSYVLTEGLYTVLALSFLVLLEGGRREAYARYQRLAALGGLLALTVLARPTAVGLAAFAAAAVLITGTGSVAQRLARVGVLAAGLALVLAPWAVRNHQRLGRWVVLTTHGGITFYQSNNPLVCANPDLRGGVAPREALPGWERISEATDVASDAEAWRLGKAFLRDNPRMIPGLLAGKFVRFWRLRSHVPLSGVKGGWWWNKRSALGRLASTIDAGLLYAAVVMPAFLVGLVITARDWRRMWGLYAMIAVHLAAALIFYGSLRARIPIEPVMAVLGACGIAWLASRLRRPHAAGG